MLPPRWLGLALLLASVATVAACADAEEPLSDDWAEAGGDCEGGKCDDASAVSRVTEPALLVNDPDVLSQLTGRGFGVARATGGDGTTNATLFASHSRTASSISAG